jgi:hypothetical protein
MSAHEPQKNRDEALSQATSKLLRSAGPATPSGGLAARAAAAAFAAADRAAREGQRVPPALAWWSWLSDALRVFVPGAAVAAVAAAALVVAAPSGGATNADASLDADPAAVVLTHEAQRDELADVLADEVES